MLGGQGLGGQDVAAALERLRFERGLPHGIPLRRIAHEMNEKESWVKRWLDSDGDTPMSAIDGLITYLLKLSHTVEETLAIQGSAWRYALALAVDEAENPTVPEARSSMHVVG